MDQFEAARLKHAKNLERKLRTTPPIEEVRIELPEVPKEKPQEQSRDAVIDVQVTLPNGGFSLRLVKKDVLQNVPAPVRLNKNEFRNRLIEGLRPLLGAVHDADRGNH